MTTPRNASSIAWGERQRHLIEWERRLTTPLPTSRRIGILSLAGGTGATTVAAATAALAAARRGTPVLAVDAQGDPSGLPAMLGWPDAEPAPRGDPDERITSSSAAAAGLPRRDGLSLYAFGRTGRATWPAEVAEWRRDVLPRGRFFPLVVTDWGRRADLAEISAIARSSHALCLVADAERGALEAAAALVPAMRALPQAPEVVVVLVDARRRGAAATRVEVGGVPAPVLRLPFDARLANGLPAARRTRRGLARVAAALVASERREAA